MPQPLTHPPNPDREVTIYGAIIEDLQTLHLLHGHQQVLDAALYLTNQIHLPFSPIVHVKDFKLELGCQDDRAHVEHHRGEEPRVTVVLHIQGTRDQENLVFFE